MPSTLTNSGETGSQTVSAKIPDGKFRKDWVFTIYLATPKFTERAYVG